MALRETDLYAPLQGFLVARGYSVRSEVKGCDVTAVKGEELVVVELKRSLNLDVLAQAAERQRVADSVYVAVPRPRAGVDPGVLHLLRRLELGLLLIAVDSPRPAVEIALQPTPFQRRRQKDRRRHLLEEHVRRSGDYNQGGSVGRKLMTAYREEALHIAAALERRGPLAPRELRALGTSDRTRAIVYDNVYGWFERLGHARYALTDAGREGLATWPELADRYRALLSE